MIPQVISPVVSYLRRKLCDFQGDSQEVSLLSEVITSLYHDIRNIVGHCSQYLIKSKLRLENMGHMQDTIGEIKYNSFTINLRGFLLSDAVETAWAWKLTYSTPFLPLFAHISIFNHLTELQFPYLENTIESLPSKYLYSH